MPGELSEKALAAKTDSDLISSVKLKGSFDGDDLGVLNGVGSIVDTMDDGKCNGTVVDDEKCNGTVLDGETCNGHKEEPMKNEHSDKKEDKIEEKKEKDEKNEKDEKDKDKDKEIPMKFLDIKILINGISEPVVVQLTNHDTVQDIRQVILEKPECCYRTCFSLYLGTTRLDDFMELHDISGLNEDSLIKVVDEPYSIREARIHIRRLRDLLVTAIEPNAFTATDNLSLSYCSVITEMDVEEEAWKSVKDPSSIPKNGINILPPSYATLKRGERTLLEPLIIQEKEASTPSCVTDLRYSAWNPPPGYRKLAGDLLYLEVCILEDPDCPINITSSSNGFFVNKTTKSCFDPRPNNESYRCQTLAALLSMLSPLFKKNFSALQRTSIKKHPLELVASPHQVFPWISPKFEHVQDPFRAEDAVTNRIGYEEQIPGQLRDWNEELQSAKELPKKTQHQRILRDRALYKITCDFVAAATRGAMAVVDGNVMAINPGEEEKMRMYIWNNLFFSFACDSREHYMKYGGDEAAYAAASLDLKGVELYNKLDVDGLHTLGTVVVDYRGYRIIAQSIIPGILQREQENSVVYGSVDGGKTIATHDVFLEKLKSASMSMKLRPHKVINEKQEDIELCSSIECKGIIGADGRHYILDLFRTFPPDVNFLDVPKASRTLINGEKVKEGKTENKPEFQYPTPHSQQLVSIRPTALEAFIGYKYVSFVKVIAIHKLNDESVKSELKIQGKKKAKESEKNKNQASEKSSGQPSAASSETLDKETAESSTKDIEETVESKCVDDLIDASETETTVNYCSETSDITTNESNAASVKDCNELSEKSENELDVTSTEECSEPSKETTSEPSEICQNKLSVASENILNEICEEVCHANTLSNVYAKEDFSISALDAVTSKLLDDKKVEECLKAEKSLEKVANETNGSKTAEELAKEQEEEDLSDIRAVEAAARAVGSLNPREFDIRFNPDAHVKEVTLSKSEAYLDKLDKSLIEDIAVFLSNTVIPKMVDDFASLTSSPIDGIALTEILHSRGINMRYLGKIASLCEQRDNLGHVFKIVIKEMVLRSAKRQFKGCMQSANQRCLSSAISHFLNCFLSSMSSPQPNIISEENIKKKKNKKKSQKLPHLPSNTNVMWMSLTPGILWMSIINHVQRHFGYKVKCVTVDELVETYKLQKLSILREFCKKVGIQILLREYEFDDKKTITFSDEDVLNIFPIVKCVTPKATDASTIFEAAQTRLQSGFFGEAHELMIEALNMFNQVYGPLHPDIVICYRAIARIHYLADDAVQAVAFQKKAVIVAERIFGIDHPETLVAYVHLALYCYHGGLVSASLKLMYRSRYLALLSYGDGHPDMATFDTNIGLMLHNQREFKLSCQFLENSRNLQMKYHGQNSLHTATAHHLVARVLTALGNYKAALNSEKTTYGIYQKHFGTDDARTKESSDALKTILNQAVMLQKTLKDIAEKGRVIPTKVENLDDANFDKKILTMVNKIEEVDENGEPVKITPKVTNSKT